MSIYSCPQCNSASVHRARHRSLFEFFVLRLVLLRPYRCWACNHRHYGYLFLKKHAGSRVYASTFATVLSQIPKAIPLLPLLLLVPWALAGTRSDLGILGFKLSGLAQVTSSKPVIAPSPRPGRQSFTYDQTLGSIVLASALPWAVGQPAPAQDKPAGEPELAPSRPAPTQQEALGTVTSTGEVTINGTPVTQMATVYADDTIGSGAGGNAVIKLQGKGNIEVYPETLMTLPNSPRYLAQLEHGRISFRPQPQVQGFQIRVGNFVVVPDPGSSETIANVSRDAGGLTHIKAVQGSVGIIELEGSRTSFIRNGQELSIAADGSIGGPPPSAPSPVTPMSASAGGGHGTIILAGVGAGGAAAAALALSGGDSTQSPVSPSNP